ncbi:MAG TPA: tetratricopeptide repeat protein [Pyrinomonadaceae bacterium]|nr:tetratricopeptide repeat protein [Pyrinomonadaceae bacterium]
MFKRLTVVLVLTLALVMGFAPYRQAVFSSALSDAEIAILNEAAVSGDMQAKEDGGNGFVKVITAPFKAIGRLFGRGGKKDDNKLHRLSEKDAKKFESAKMTRVVDARNTVPQSTPETIDPKTGETDLASDANAADLNKKRAREHLQRGRELFNQNDLNGAINSLLMAVSLDRELWDAHNLLGVAYEMKGLRSKALESLGMALKADKPQPEHLNDFGYILIKNGEYSRAVKYLKRAVKAQPDNQRFLNNLGLALVEIGKHDEAYKAFEKAMGEFDGRMNMATRLLRLGYDKEAIQHLERCREMQPNSLDVVYRLSVLYARNGRTAEADEANKVFLSLKATATAAEKK